MMTCGSKQHRCGRSPRQELLDDMREELLKVKKANTQLALDNRILNTKILRLTKEIKAYSSNVDAKNHYPESFETTSTQTQRKPSSKKREGSVNRQRFRPYDTNAESSTDVNNHEEDNRVGLLSDQIRILQEKNKNKLRVAKAYAEQNRKLKERLKQMREEYHELKKNHSHFQSTENETIQSTPDLDELGTWSTSQLIELIVKLEATRLRSPIKRSAGEIEVPLDIPDSDHGGVERSDKTNTKSAIESGRLSQHGSTSKPHNNEQVPFDVLLYVLSELAIAHNERQIVSRKLKRS